MSLFVKPEWLWEGPNSKISNSRVWFYCRCQLHCCEGEKMILTTSLSWVMEQWHSRESTFASSGSCNRGMWTFKMETIVKVCDVLVSHAVWSVLRCREELLGKEGGICTVTAFRKWQSDSWPYLRKTHVKWGKKLQPVTKEASQRWVHGGPGMDPHGKVKTGKENRELIVFNHPW